MVVKVSASDIQTAAAERYEADLQLLKTWVCINSGTHHVAGNREQLHAIAERFAALPGSGRIEEFEHPADDTDVDTYRACYVHRCRPEAPVQVLLNGHVDTVFDASHPFQDVTLLDAQHLRGPGVTDMKGGIVILLASLELFETFADAELRANLGWEVLLTCDEEIGSVHSRPLLERAAERNQLGITFESSLPDGKLVRRRMGVGYGHARVTGRSAHAGRNFHDGRNAIVKLCDWVQKIHALNHTLDGVIVNTGSMQGGGPLNVVSDHAEARFNLRVQDQIAEQALFQALERIHSEIQESGYTCEWHARLNRRAKEAGPAFDALFEAWQRAASVQGELLDWCDTGGGSDGNLLEAFGLPIIDNLGMMGQHIHSSNEVALLPSLTSRSCLVTTFLLMLSAGEFDALLDGPFAQKLRALQQACTTLTTP